MSSIEKRQLQMVMIDVEVTIPVLPQGYELRLFRPEDTAGYLDLMKSAGFDGWDPERLEGAFRNILPDGLFVIQHESGTIVATTMANHNPVPLHPFGGELGWVAGHPDHGGRGLGLAVCAAVVNRFREAGYRRIYLSTDDHRLPAIKTYLKLGFVPFLFMPDMPARWESVCQKINWPFKPDLWPTGEEVKPAPVESDERPNVDHPDRYQPRHKWLPGRRHKAYPGGGDADAFGDESLYKPSHLGSVCVQPSQLSAGSVSPLKIIFTTGSAGMSAGTSVHFGMRGQNPLGKMSGNFTITGPDSCSLRPDGHGFILEEGVLSEGQEVSLQWEPFEWTPLASRKEFKTTLTIPGRLPQQRLPEPAVIDVLPLEADRVELTLPCTYKSGEILKGRVSIRDRFDNRVTICTSVPVSDGKSVKNVLLKSGIGDFTIEGGTSEVIQVSTSGTSNFRESRSNPSLLVDDYQLFVGDLHTHCFLSEAEGYTDELYRWAIEDRRLDFVSVVPQSHGWHDNETWTVTKYMNERFLKEGEFVTLLGFEWQHTGYGDKVVHYLGGDQPYLPVDDPRYTCPAKLYDALRDSDAFIISHHPSYPPGNWCPATDYDCIDTDIERVVELWSMHGSSEGYDPADRPLIRSDQDYTVMSALRKGVRLGFVAGSDTHSARPGGSAKEPRPHWGGLAAVWAKDLTRRSIFEAVYSRRTYALTQARMIVRMTVNDAWMGSELPSADRAQILIEAWTPGTIAKVEIIKNTRLLKEFGPFGDTCRIEFEDRTDGPAFYHCRITQMNGELAVCSPVWIG